jgi:hypothetical protein
MELLEDPFYGQIGNEIEEGFVFWPYGAGGWHLYDGSAVHVAGVLCGFCIWYYVLQLAGKLLNGLKAFSPPFVEHYALIIYLPVGVLQGNVVELGCGGQGAVGAVLLHQHFSKVATALAANEVGGRFRDSLVFYTIDGYYFGTAKEDGFVIDFEFGAGVKDYVIGWLYDAEHIEEQLAVGVGG